METLDPTDWEAMRALAHRMVDDAIDYTAQCASGRSWQPVPPRWPSGCSSLRHMSRKGAEAAYDEFVHEHPALSHGQHPPALLGLVHG